MRRGEVDEDQAKLTHLRVDVRVSEGCTFRVRARVRVSIRVRLRARVRVRGWGSL